MTPTEAYQQLQRVLEQVNAITGSMFIAHRMEQLEIEDSPDNKIFSEVSSGDAVSLGEKSIGGIF